MRDQSHSPARASAEPAARLELLALFAVAVAWPWAYLVRLGHTPFSGSLNADSRIYWQWSEAILRHGPLPASPFYLAPLYPYALAGLRAVGAGTIAQVLAVQALFGAGAVVLLSDATARLVGRRVALIVGGTLACFQCTTFFTGLVLPESLLFFIDSLLIWFVVTSDWSRARLAWFAAYGLLVGVLAEGRASNSVLLVLVLPLAWTRSSAWPDRLRALAAAVVTFIVCCLPAGLANLRASGETIPFTYNLGYNLYVGNNPDADGTYVDITRGSIPVPLAGTSPTTGGALDGRAFVLASTGRRLSPAESSGYWAGLAAGFVRQHPLRAARLAGRKLLLLWNREEIPQIESMASFARTAGPLGLPVVGSFGFMAMLGLAGVAWAARRGAAERWLVGYLTLLACALLPFFVTDRYRFHLLPALAVLAGISIAEIARSLRHGSPLARIRWAPALAVAAAIVFAPLGARATRNDEWTITADRAMRLLDRGEYAAAAAAFADAEAALGELPARPLSSSARTDLAAFEFRYGIALEALGRRADAILRWERAASLDPNDAASLGRLSVAYGVAGRTADVARVRKLLGSVAGGRGQLLVNDGWSAAERGDPATAERCFVAAVAASPDLSVAWEGLIRVRIQSGRLDEASRALDQARGAGLEPVAAGIYECFIAVERHDLSAARKAFDGIPSDAAPPDPVLARFLAYSRHALGVGPVSR